MPHQCCLSLHGLGIIDDLLDHAHHTAGGSVLLVGIETKQKKQTNTNTYVTSYTNSYLCKQTHMLRFVSPCTILGWIGPI